MNTDTVKALDALSVLRTAKQNELDAINLACSILDGTWKGQLTELDAAKADIADLTSQLAVASPASAVLLGP